MHMEKFFQEQKIFFAYQEPCELFDAILAFLPQLGADFGSILIQTAANTIYFRSSIPGQEEMVGPAGRRFAARLIEEGVEGAIMRRGTSEIIADVQLDPRWYRAEYLMEVCRSAVLLPISLFKVQAEGVLLLGSKQVDVFSSVNLPFLEIVTAQLGFAIENTLLFRNQVEHLAQLSVINEVSRAATSILNANLMLTTITQAIQQSFSINSVGIYHFSAPEKKIILDAFTGADGRSHAQVDVSPSAIPLVTWVLQHGSTAVVNDIKLDDRFSAEQKLAHIKSQLVIPIKLGSKIIGALSLESAELDAFDPALVSALGMLGEQLAVAIENARLYDELNDTVNELLSLNSITQSVTASLDMQQTLTLISEHVTVMLNVAATSVALRDDETDEVWFAAASGAGSSTVLGKRLHLGQGIIGWVAKHGRSLIVQDVWRDPRFFREMDKHSGFNTKSILCVPLQTKGRLIGAIEAINKLEGQFTTQDLNRLTDLTAPAASAIENAQLYQQLAQRMTQVENLRAFNQNIIENITTGLIALDTEKKITVFNKAAAALLGLNATDLLGKPVETGLSLVPQLIAPLLAPLVARETKIARDLELSHWGGGVVTVTVTAAPIYSADNQLSGVVGLIEDITELKTLEAERRRLDRLAALGEMSAVVAHELRNPIAGIAAGVNYLTRHVAADNTIEQASQMILKEVDRVHRIVEDILLVARPLNLQKTPQAIESIIDTIRQRFAAKLKDGSIQPSFHIAKDLPHLWLDRARIEQVFNNLFDNALQAMPNGGSIDVSVAQSVDQSELVCLFRDTGPGIPTVERQKIFDPFYTTKTRGTGLGLALCRQIIEAHHGHIRLVNSERGGTTFEIRLPLLQENQ